MRLLWCFPIPFLVAIGCGSPTPVVNVEPKPSVQPEEEVAEKTRWENPGGMWTPEQLVEHADTLKTLGLTMDVETLSKPLNAPLAAIVSLGGCSASFVSNTGLMVTNHHCVQGALQYHSDETHDYVTEGFLARTLDEEKWNGPGSRVRITRTTTDITGTILGGLEDATPRDRYNEIDLRKKRIVAACEIDAFTHCRVASFFQGSEYKLIESMELQDIRMVYVPHSGVGFFGGDTDNWMWPRHTGDFSFYRAYVGPDGKPAKYSKDNIPYRPSHVLALAKTPLTANDLVLVAGYPGRTYRHRSADFVSDAIEWRYPRRIAKSAEILAIVTAVTKKDPEARRKSTAMVGRLNNVLKNNRGLLEGLQKSGVLAKKRALETAMRAWVDENAEQKARYGEVFSQMELLQKQRLQTRERNAGVGELAAGQLLRVASTIVQMSEARALPDQARVPRFQQRRWADLEARFSTFDSRYHEGLDKALLRLGIERAMRRRENHEWLAMLFGKSSLQSAELERIVEGMYSRSSLSAKEVRMTLLKTATMQSLRRSKDPFIKLALKLRPLEKQIRAEEKNALGTEAQLNPLYMEVLREFSKGPMAPDANSTLRVTFGTVRGYAPNASSPVYKPFTVLSEVVAKHRDTWPFDMPDAQLAAIATKQFGPYLDKSLGEVPVNFLSDVDTTGGSSGSATLNANGELVGLSFDGNYESIVSDYVFLPAITRAIHVDSRYMLWNMDAVDGADRLLREMGIAPVLDSP